jgi:hypothetical protein
MLRVSRCIAFASLHLNPTNNSSDLQPIAHSRRCLSDPVTLQRSGGIDPDYDRRNRSAEMFKTIPAIDAYDNSLWLKC